MGDDMASQVDELWPSIPQCCDVLIVEDDELQSEEIAGFLARVGLVVHTVETGSAAAHLARTCRPHVALLDYNLPDVLGTELAVEIREIVPDLAIIVMSGRLEGLSEETTSALGISTFLNKPVKLSALRQLVVSLVEAHRASRSRH